MGQRCDEGAGPGRPAMEAIVAIPVRDEAEHIGACLAALDRQSGAETIGYGTVLLLNNSTDGTAGILADLVPRLSHPVRIVERHSPEANAGWARRGAMDAAAAWLEAEGCSGGAILTTDADSRVPPDWICCNLAALAAGADAVAGQIALDPRDREALPDELNRRGLLEAEYEALLTELSALVDPDPDDPWPTHWTTSGASLAVTLAAYRQVDGMPPIALGDDRAFVARLQAADLVVRHDPAIVVTTSGRLEGRAAGGVADTIRARRDDPDSFCDERLEPVLSAIRRYRWRRRIRLLRDGGRWRESGIWASKLGLGSDQIARMRELSRLGELTAFVDRESPRLASRLIAPAELRRQIRVGRIVLRLCRLFRP